VIDDQYLLVVDPVGRTPSPPERVGEVWVSGPSVARGYWDQPELTGQTFGARLAGRDDDTPFLRTGDLGFVHDGELYVTGRLKALLIVAGRNVQAEDVERTVAGSHPAGRPGGVAVTALYHSGRERLIVFQEIDPRRAPAQADLQAIVHAIRLRVAEQHQLPVGAVVLVRPGRIPRTSSGKVRRECCAETYRAGRLETLFDWHPARVEAG
jgi:acyl-CoA synthetase (AMP-forming)/AMP-acid ligase II